MFRLFVFAAILAAWGPAPAGAQIQAISYDAFLALPEARQKIAFHDADPETKAMLKRAHAQRWLDRNRANLSPRQIAAVERGIAFITPALYRAEPKDTLKQEIELTRSLECALGRRNVRAAFTFLPPEKPSLGSRLQDWLYWVHVCLLE